MESHGKNHAPVIALLEKNSDNLAIQVCVVTRVGPATYRYVICQKRSGGRPMVSSHLRKCRHGIPPRVPSHFHFQAFQSWINVTALTAVCVRDSEIVDDVLAVAARRIVGIDALDADVRRRVG